MNMVPVGCWPVQRRSRSRVRIAAGCAAAAVMLLAGCHVPGLSSAAGHAPPGSSITVASVPGIGDAPLYIALHEGLFRQAGLTVRIHSYSSVGAEVTALHSGRANVAVGDYADFFFAQEHDARASMVVVADGYDARPNVMDVLVGPHSGITGPQGLLGKTIGTAAPQLMPDISNGQPYSLDTVAASSVLMNDGVQPTAVTWKPMPANDLIGALRSHRVDAILVTEPEVFQAESQLGAQSILDACSGESASLPLEGYFAPASFAKQHRAALVAFRSALMRAQADAAQAVPREAALTHYEGMSDQTASLITMGTYPTSLKAASLQRVADLMSFYGALPRPLEVAHMTFPTGR
jgi:NitT/TauT family transport system substrate-binding protein